MRYIAIDKERIPYHFNIRLDGQTYGFRLDYNRQGDCFTADLFRHGEVLIFGERINYGRPLFSQHTLEALPDVAIVPFDLKQEETEVNYDTLMDSVFLYLVRREDFDAVR